MFRHKETCEFIIW